MQTDEQARWLLRQAQALAGRREGSHETSIRHYIRATGAPPELQRRAWEMVKQHFFEGYCPIHGTPFVVVVLDGARRANCTACKWWWGKPQPWPGEGGVA